MPDFYEQLSFLTNLKLPLAAALGRAELFFQLWQWTRAYQMPVAKLGQGLADPQWEPNGTFLYRGPPAAHTAWADALIYTHLQ